MRNPTGGTRATSCPRASPRPKQIRSWWEQRGSRPAPESARRARHAEEGVHDADTYAEYGGGQPNRHPADAARHPEDGDESEGVAGEKTTVAGEAAATENSIGKPNTGVREQVAGVAGGFEYGGEGLCIHNHLGGKGCYLCDPNHPLRVREGAKA